MTRPRLINHVCVRLVEIWLSILVRKLLRRGNFRSVEDLRYQVLSFISYFNRTMAKAFKWTTRASHSMSNLLISGPFYAGRY
jgi:hypothetical protein